MTQVEYVGYFMLGLAFFVSLTVGIITIIRYAKENARQSEERADAQIKASKAVVNELQIVVAKLGENFENQISLLTKFDKRLIRVENKQQEMEVNCARNGHYKKVRNET